MRHLKDRAIISISGAEAKSFLQGLITNDIGKLGPFAPLYAALLTPQGKILFDFLIIELGGAVLIDCWAPISEALLKRLTIYRLRAKVELKLRDDVAIAWSPREEPEAADLLPDPRLKELGCRSVLPRESIAGLIDGTGAYLNVRLGLDVPEAGDFGSDKMFALDAGLEELRGVSFEKGCYVGQELTARMKHRGTARKRLLAIVPTAGLELPPAGTDIRAAGNSVGEIAATYGGRGFGLIRLDRWTRGETAEAGGRALHISIPQWLQIEGSPA